MRPGPVEQAYEDVLQNLEFAIVKVFRQNPELSDWDVRNAVEALARYYNAAAKGRTPEHRPLNTQLAQDVYDMVGAMCEWRRGETTLFNAEDDTPVDIPVDPLEPQELVACLRRIKKSIQMWTKRGGRQGYLNFVNDFFPYPPEDEVE